MIRLGAILMLAPAAPGTWSYPLSLASRVERRSGIYVIGNLLRRSNEDRRRFGVLNQWLPSDGHMA